MSVNRRQFLIGAGLAAAAATGGLTACAPGSSGGGPGRRTRTTLALAYWSNPTRTKNTDAEIAAFMAANPDLKSRPPGEFATYWDKLATQTAGGTAPDIIQMDMAYIADYGSRGALLDLTQVRRRHVQVRGRHRRSGQDQRHAGRGQCRHQQRTVLRQPQGLREGQDGHARRQDLDLGRPDAGGRRGGQQGGGDVRRHRCSNRTPCSEPGCVSMARSCSPRRRWGSPQPRPSPGSR